MIDTIEHRLDLNAVEQFRGLEDDPILSGMLCVRAAQAPKEPFVAGVDRFSDILSAVHRAVDRLEPTAWQPDGDEDDDGLTLAGSHDGRPFRPGIRLCVGGLVVSSRLTQAGSR